MCTCGTCAGCAPWRWRPAELENLPTWQEIRDAEERDTRRVDAEDWPFSWMRPNVRRPDGWWRQP